MSIGGAKDRKGKPDPCTFRTQGRALRVTGDGLLTAGSGLSTL